MSKPDWLELEPIHEPLPYRGSEEIDGEFRPIWLGDAVARLIPFLVTEGGALYESPIEQELGVHLKYELPATLKLVPQFRFGRYRMDFAVLSNAGKPCLFIECDGRQFHSTAKQLRRDNAKDAAAARAGIPLLRFPGWIIFREARNCARLVADFVKGFA